MKELFSALSLFHLEDIKIEKNKEVIQRYKDKQEKWQEKKYSYADLHEYINKCRTPLAKHGLSIIQKYSKEQTLITVLAHSSGESIESEFPLDGNWKTAFSRMQALGTDTTYLRRYAYQMILGIVGEDDTDANEHDAEIKDKRDTPLAKKEPPQTQATSTAEASQKQIDLIKSLGGRPIIGMGKAQASSMIESLMKEQASKPKKTNYNTDYKGDQLPDGF